VSIADTGNRNEQERQAMQVAEDAREDKWMNPSFCAELFAGNFNFDLIYPFPEQSAEDKKIGDAHLAKISDFLLKNHDPLEVDRTGDIPQSTYKGLAELGCFGIKIPKEYGGLGLSQTNYNRIVSWVGNYCSSTGVLLSAHQSIGVPKPLTMFGTEEQKKKWLPRLAKGEISAFALTEVNAGSDPAGMSTTATPTDDGWVINGEKLWCTNGTIADQIVVMAVTPPKVLPNGKEKKQISAFIVEKTMPGFSVKHRCSFMGLSGIQNGVLKFDNVKVPKENLLWGEGKGLKLALITLNTGRLTIPAAAAGSGKTCFAVSKTWAKERHQWGASIGEHEASAVRLVLAAGGSYALDALTNLTSGLADRNDFDLRIEASLAKLFSTGTSWKIIDNTLQLRGGRGYETAESLRARGEDAYPIEKLMRDARINTIIEGTSNIQRLFVSREALDMHLKIAGDLLSPHKSLGQKFGVAVKAGLFYAWWYPKQWIHFSYWPRFLWAGSWEAKYLRYINKMSHKLARKTFHAMALNGPGLEKRQRTLGRIVDTGTNLFVMATCLSLYLTRKKNGTLNPHEDRIVQGSCMQFKNMADDAYKRIKVWPKKSQVIKTVGAHLLHPIMAE
jgi:alkylation response protein AidB-like acyl-CoA dehydrogenase